MKKRFESLRQKWTNLKEKISKKNNKKTIKNKLIEADCNQQLLTVCCIALFGTCILIPQLMGPTLAIVISYFGLKAVYPRLKNWKAKITDFITKKINKIKENKKENKKEKSIEKKEKKPIKNVIKNFKLVSLNKFKEKLTVKRDTNGHKIVNGSYRIKGKKIIDNKTYISFTEIKREIENTDSKEKIYTKTK